MEETSERWKQPEARLRIHVLISAAAITNSLDRESRELLDEIDKLRTRFTKAELRLSRKLRQACEARVTLLGLDIYKVPWKPDPAHEKAIANVMAAVNQLKAMKSQLAR